MITMADVAKKAGVSPTTASFVLNNRQAELRISEDTRQRVLIAAQEMGYHRNELARAVSRGKNFVLGFYKMAIGEQELQLLEGVLRGVTEAGYLLKVLPYDDAQNYHNVARQCVEQRLAGLVARSFPDADVTLAFYEELDRYGIPVVFVDDNLTVPGTTCITSDDDLGYRLTVRHLVELGHRRLVFIAGDSIHPQSRLRKVIYGNVLREHGLDVREEDIVDSDWNLERAEQLTRRLFQERAGRPTALVCAGDELAAVAIRALQRMGLRVPEDVSVIGYSNFSFAKLLNPPLTTISQPFEEMGAVAGQILLQRLQGASSEDAPSQIALPTELIIRESTAAPSR